MEGLPDDPAAGDPGVVLSDVARTLVLWRHGRTQWNVDDRFQGHTDVALDDLGQAQARAAAPLLAGLRPTAIVTSDLMRARATAERLADLTGQVLRVDARLRETDGGTWEGRTAAEIRAVDEPAYLHWRSGADVPAGGGETRSQLADRAVAALADAWSDLPDGGVLVAVTHGGTARAAIGRLLGLPPDQWRVIGGLANACWSVLTARPSPAGEPSPPGHWRLTEHNAGTLPEPVVGDDR